MGRKTPKWRDEMRRRIRRLLLLAILGVGGVAAYNHWSENDWPRRPQAAALHVHAAKEQATRVANQAATKAGNAAERIGDKMSERALTAKIKSKMVLDDHVNARAINVDTSGSVVTLSGTVLSKYQHDRAVALARDTEGVTRVVDKLRIRQN